MNNRKILAWGICVTIIILYTMYTVTIRPKPKPEILRTYYLDELRILLNTTWVFNSTDAWEAVQWAMDNLNGTDAIIVNEGILGGESIYKVGIQG